VLADGELSEHETVKRLGEAQKLTGIYSARVAHHQRQLTELSTALEASARAAEQELIGLINTEAGRRSDAVKESVIKVFPAVFPTSDQGPAFADHDPIGYHRRIIQ
jgi:hypothetical protein